MSAPVIEVDITARQGGFTGRYAFDAGEGLTALFGRSGAGKSTALAAIAGLIRPADGHIRIDGTTVFDRARSVDLPPNRRRVGFVFQDARLFPHLSVRSNLTFARRHGGADADGPDLATVAGILGIENLLDRRPHSLSGGERQRVAIGRALLSAPRLLLFDEPFAALDARRKLEILPLIERMRDEFAVPMLYVSHNVEEVARLASSVVLIEDGRTVRHGTPAEILGLSSRPPSEARGEAVSVLNAVVGDWSERWGLSRLDHPAGPITVPGRAGRVGEARRIVINGTDVSLALAPPRDTSVRTILPAEIGAVVTDDGPLARVDLALAGGDRLIAFLTRRSAEDLGLQPGGRVFALIKAASLEPAA